MVIITSVPVRALLLRGLHPDPDQRVQPGEEHQVRSLSVRFDMEYTFPKDLRISQGFNGTPLTTFFVSGTRPPMRRSPM